MDHILKFTLFYPLVVKDWIFVCPPQRYSYVEILTPNMMVSGWGPLGRGLGYEGEVPMIGISAFHKQPQRALSASSHHVRLQWEGNQVGSHPNTPVLAGWPWTFRLQNDEKSMAVV